MNPTCISRRQCPFSRNHDFLLLSLSKPPQKILMPLPAYYRHILTDGGHRLYHMLVLSMDGDSLQALAAPASARVTVRVAKLYLATSGIKKKPHMKVLDFPIGNFCWG